MKIITGFLSICPGAPPRSWGTVYVSSYDALSRKSYLLFPYPDGMTGPSGVFKSHGIVSLSDGRGAYDPVTLCDRD